VSLTVAVHVVGLPALGAAGSQSSVVAVDRVSTCTVAWATLPP